MKNKHLSLTIKKLALGLFLIMSMSFIGCTRQPNVQRVSQVPPADTIRHAGEPPIVYFTHNISPAGLMAAYEALGLEATGNVAIKVHTGEPGERQHFIKPEFMKDLVQRVNGTIVETNTITGGENFSRRATTAFHYQLAKDHGFTSIAPVIIMDETAEISIPVLGGKHLTENYIGARFNEFDFHIVLSHFKGHVNGGFGGALKNIAIGYASGAGKAWIHSGGVTRNTPNSVDVMRFFFTDNFQFRWDQDTFLESMAEAAKSITDQTRGRILYINVMNHLSVDCDCGSNPTVPTMADIGILASFDPVALDQACVDLVYSAPDGKDLIERIESLNGLLTLKYAEKLGVGSREYQLIQL